MDAYSARETICSYAKDKFGTEPEYLFRTSPSTAVLRHEGNKGKWYGVIMRVNGKKLSANLPDDEVMILNLKGDPLMVGALRMNPGYYPAFHMNKENWYSIILDGTVSDDEIFGLIDISFELTDSRPKSRQGKTTDWIVPSNPKMYDIIKGFESDDLHDWTQSSRVSVGDNVYIYVGAPYSAIMYKCVAVEVDLPRYWDPRPDKKAMRLKILKRYGPDLMNKEVLRAHGVRAVRGPRYMPKDLIEEIEAIDQ